MGTNFYWLHGDGEPKSYERHIGKRSGAGMYCWDCDVPLVEGGVVRVHDHRAPSLKACPKCGAAAPTESIRDSAAGVELGFAAAPTERKCGVASCSSFTWAVMPATVRARARKSHAVVEDEYGRTMSVVEFLQMVEANCPIEFTDQVGRNFS